MSARAAFFLDPTQTNSSGHDLRHGPEPTSRFIKARSSSLKRNSGSTSAVSPQTVSTLMSGNSLPKFARRSVRCSALKSSGSPRRTIAFGDFLFPTTYSASRASFSILCAYCSRASPSSVSEICPAAVVRLSSAAPKMSSSFRICWLTVDCVRWTRLAARVKERDSTTATKLCSKSMSSTAYLSNYPLSHRC